MGVGVVIANADGSDSWGADYFGQVNRVFWLPSGERVGIAGGICARVGVVPVVAGWGTPRLCGEWRE